MPCRAGQDQCLLFQTARTNSRRPSSFTLVEMLVALAVVSILVLLITSVLTQLNRMWAQSQSQTQRQQSGRALLNFLARDIAKAMLPLSLTSQASLQFVINPPALSGSGYNNRDNIFFQAPVAVDERAGELAEVGYFVQWQTGPASAQLCRFFVNPTDAANYLIYTSPTAWLTSDVVKNVAPGTSASSYQGLLAENVIGSGSTPMTRTAPACSTATAASTRGRRPRWARCPASSTSPSWCSTPRRRRTWPAAPCRSPRCRRWSARPTRPTPTSACRRCPRRSSPARPSSPRACSSTTPHEPLRPSSLPRARTPPDFVRARHRAVFRGAGHADGAGHPGRRADRAPDRLLL
ncbi:MAG: prepilin-type N-terminal cleavage/methylation domain-containing protein [Verrucomicrobiota bacterium]